jgi:hypothetical protein
MAEEYTKNTAHKIRTTKFLNSLKCRMILALATSVIEHYKESTYSGDPSTIKGLTSSTSVNYPMKG